MLRKVKPEQRHRIEAGSRARQVPIDEIVMSSPQMSVRAEIMKADTGFASSINLYVVLNLEMSIVHETFRNSGAPTIGARPLRFHRKNLVTDKGMAIGDSQFVGYLGCGCQQNPDAHML